MVLRLFLVASILFSAGPAYADCRASVTTELQRQGVPYVQRLVIRPALLSVIQDLNDGKMTVAEARVSVRQFIARRIRHAGTVDRYTRQAMRAIAKLRAGECSEF